MRAWFTAVVVGLALGSAGAEVWAVEREGIETPPPPPAPGAGVQVTVADSISDAETIRGWIEERAASVLGASARALESGEIIRVDVRGRAFAYEIEVVLVRHGTVLDGEHQPRPIITCECGSQELLERIGEAVEAGAKVLGEAAEREREEAARAEAERQRQVELERQAAERAAAERRRRRLSTLERVGIGVLGGGAAVTLSGIIMAVQPPQEVSVRQFSFRHWESPGHAVIGIGATAMATGIAVLIVDVVRCRKHRERCGAPTATGVIDGARWAATPRRGAR